MSWRRLIKSSRSQHVRPLLPDCPPPDRNRVRAGRFHLRKPCCESKQHVASYRPRNLETKTDDICGGAFAWAPRARQVRRATPILSRECRAHHHTDASQGVGHADRPKRQAWFWARRIGIVLLRGASEVDSREPSSAASVLAETRVFVAGAQVDLTAAREAKYVAKSVSATKKSVATAALKTAEAASRQWREGRRRCPCGSQHGGHRRPDGKRHPDPGRCPRRTSRHRRIQGR
jgi:hypothetical protein